MTIATSARTSTNTAERLTEAHGPGRIGVEAVRRLHLSGYSALRDVSCDVREGCMSLHGRLPSYYLKQMAQAVVSDVEGVGRVINAIEVAAPRRSETAHA